MLKRFIPIICIASLLLAITPLGYSALKVQIPYTAFNSLALTSYTLDKNYTAWEGKIYYQLTADTSHSKYALVRFCYSDTSPYIEISFLGDGVLAVYKSSNGIENVWIAEGQYTKGGLVKVVLTSDGLLSVYSSNKAVVKDYVFQPLAITQVSGHGDAGATAGYIEVYVSAGTQEMTKTVQSFLPLIITIAMFVMAIGLLRKYGKI